MIQRQSAACWLQNQRSEMARALQKITDWPERAQMANYCVKTLAKNCRVSVRTLERHFQSQYGLSPQAWINELWAQRAQQLLSASKSIKGVASKLGYDDNRVHNFTRDFKKYCGITPSQFLTGVTPTCWSWIV